MKWDWSLQFKVESGLNPSANFNLKKNLKISMSKFFSNLTKIIFYWWNCKEHIGEKWATVYTVYKLLPILLSGTMKTTLIIIIFMNVEKIKSFWG